MKHLIRYTINDASKIDKETRSLVGMLSAARIKVGLEVAKRLREIEDNKLYLKLDEQSYPTFNKYIDSLGINYRTIRELIGLYEAFVLTGGYSIDELAEISYHRLTTIKSHLFKYVGKKYYLALPKKEIDDWIQEIHSDITIEDLRQKRKEEEIGDHEHEFDIINLRVCRHCKLKERF